MEAMAAMANLYSFIDKHDDLLTLNNDDFPVSWNFVISYAIVVIFRSIQSHLRSSSPTICVQ